MQNSGNLKGSKLFNSRTRICTYCGKEFIIPGRLSDYIYKVKGKYACCYHCYLAMKKLASREPIESQESSSESSSQKRYKKSIN